jgi:Spx/MgsR family transcriptional regulator
MKVKIYGIPNCGSVKKARTFLEEKGIDYDFHDYKKTGIDGESLKRWCEEFGWETVLNKKGLTWRGLDDTIKNAVINQETAIQLMLKNNSAIKRPVVVSDKGNTVGFQEEEYERIFI